VFSQARSAKPSPLKNFGNTTRSWGRCRFGVGRDGESVGGVQPRDEVGVDGGSRVGVVLANRAVPVAKEVGHEEDVADNASSEGSLNPVMKLALIAAPVLALYWPTVPVDNILLGFESLLNPIL
jgi:hypothetical protein